MDNLTKATFMKTYRHQSFNLPDSIMFYISMNPTNPKVYQKMVKTCKYFFFKNPILVTSLSTTFDGEKWKISNGKSINMTKLTSKLWIIKALNVPIKKDNLQNVVSSFIIPKLYRCDAKFVSCFRQNLSFNNYCFLISSAEIIHFYQVSVKYENGSHVPLENLVAAFQNGKTFGFTCESVFNCTTSKTFKELLKLPHFFQFDDFSLHHIPEAFDIEAFYIYMKKNKRTKFYLKFDASISDVYKKRLEKIIDEILAAKSPEYKPPFITFEGLDEKKIRKLFDLSD